MSDGEHHEERDGAEQLTRRVAWLAFGVLLLVLAGHSMLETARDALFLASLPVDQLPWLYLIIAGLTLGVTGLESAIGKALHHRDWLSITLLGSAVATAAMWAGADFVSVSSLWVLYAWTGLYATVTLLQLWLSVSAAFDVGEAKRHYALVGAGALVGATAGAVIARALLGVVSTHNLVLGAAVCMAIAGLAARFALRPAVLRIRRRHRSRGSLPTLVEPRQLGEVARHPYARHVLGLVLLTSVSVTLADYLFKRNVAAAVAAPDLGAFFATAYAVMNLVALALQLFAVKWLLKHIGAHWSLLVLPGLLAVGGAWMGLGGVLLAAVLTKGAEGALKHSIHGTALEVLFVPFSSRLRADVKTVSDVLGHRGGQALGSAVVLIATLHPAVHHALPWVLCAAAGAALLVGWLTKRRRGRAGEGSSREAPRRGGGSEVEPPDPESTDAPVWTFPGN